MGFFRQFSENITIENTKLKHADGVNLTIRLAFKVPLDEDCDDCIGPRAIRAQIDRFAEGQFVAIYNDESVERVVGTAHTMRTHQAPHASKWFDTIGGVGIRNHAPEGEWLYGVEMAVRPSFRRQGIGTALYQARFDLVKRLNLKGWYAGGMLMGYDKYRGKMSVETYGNKVLAGDIIDPTVTMQHRRGFELRELILDYMEEEQAGDAAILIVWENPNYQSA
ncbi:MAG: GNAT family N-acetyltransferase [Chloroflexota bacterium]